MRSRMWVMVSEMSVVTRSGVSSLRSGSGSAARASSLTKMSSTINAMFWAVFRELPAAPQVPDITWINESDEDLSHTP
jgi:hypothetical protein